MYDPPPRFYTNISSHQRHLYWFKKSASCDIYALVCDISCDIRLEFGKSASSSMFCLSVIIIIGDEKGILQRLSVWKQDVKKRCIVWRKMEAVNKTILEGFSQCAVARITETPPSSPSRHLEKFCCSAADLWPITFLLSAPFTFLPRRAEL